MFKGTTKISESTDDLDFVYDTKNTLDKTEMQRYLITTGILMFGDQATIKPDLIIAVGDPEKKPSKPFKFKFGFDFDTNKQIKRIPESFRKDDQKTTFLILSNFPDYYEFKVHSSILMTHSNYLFDVLNSELKEDQIEGLPVLYFDHLDPKVLVHVLGYCYAGVYLAGYALYEYHKILKVAFEWRMPGLIKLMINRISLQLISFKQYNFKQCSNTEVLHYRVYEIVKILQNVLIEDVYCDKINDLIQNCFFIISSNYDIFGKTIRENMEEPTLTKYMKYLHNNLNKHR